MSDLSQAQAISLKSKVSPAEWAMRVDIAACYRLVAHFGMNDLVYNHISGRVPGEDGHFLIFAILLRLKDGNVFARRIKDDPDLCLFGAGIEALIRLQLRHQVVNFNAKSLFAILYLAIQKQYVRL